MGVPKFYRWISERYPNIGRVIHDNQLPDFDNFYLDMNGIIHACSHVNEDNCETNVSEEEIFRNIFHYLDFLFRMIKPKKVFFMAVDGVAPRAKMNQQRARRFRAGQDRTRKLKTVADKSGKTFEETAKHHFDTNAITPGTQFMENLDRQLRYFINVKLTTDPLWEGVDIHLSGHLTPGEGEHKIMEFIRYSRSQPNYDVNTRHCLYGLDADLIMLALVTHETHFALLREEVKYGSKKISKILTPEQVNWHLLHINLLRDYIDLDFRSLKDKLSFSYALESIIDDWILMGYLVGNDFIPHLPHIHIQEEALTILWDTYKNVLPTLDGYMNESGELNLKRFEIYLSEMAKFDNQRFAYENDSFRHLSKLKDVPRSQLKKKERSTTNNNADDADFNFGVLEKLDEPVAEANSNPKELCSLFGGGNGAVEEENSSSTSDGSSEKSDDDDDEEREEVSIPLKPIDTHDLDRLPLIEAEFRLHKNHYYREKMKINLTSSDELKPYVEKYIEALQWILKYYYQGCPSWSWFYPHHYAPYLSDLKDFKDLTLKFDLGTPFQPFEQLLGVLPPTSRHLLPVQLQSLMIDPSSPLIHFYPDKFELDQNEKKHDWESIVLLPFIDEKLLLDVISQHYPQLDVNQQKRNQHSSSLCFQTSDHLTPTEQYLRENPYFPPLNETRARAKEIPLNSYRCDAKQLKFGPFPQTKSIVFPKFPVLNVLPYQYGFKKGAVQLFEMYSRAETLVLNMTRKADTDVIHYEPTWKRNGTNESTTPFQIKDIRTLLHRYLGKKVFVNWPHLQQGLVCAISDYQHIYLWTNHPGQSLFDPSTFNMNENYDSKHFIQTPIFLSVYPIVIPADEDPKSIKWQKIPLNDEQSRNEYQKAININRLYELRRGISIGPIPILLYVCPLIGERIQCSSMNDRCENLMCFSNQANAFSLQTTLFSIPNFKSRSVDTSQLHLKEYFKTNDVVFLLNNPFYSTMGHVQQIVRNNANKYTITCQIETSYLSQHPDLHRHVDKFAQAQLNYFTAQQVAERTNIHPNVIGKITGKVNVFGGKKQRKKAIPMNVGLGWKLNKPLKELYGYTKKFHDIWHYSEAAIKIIMDYKAKFPEIFDELTRRPQNENYYETNIWTLTDGKSRLPEIRAWMKSLPTYSMNLNDGQWDILDTPVIEAIDQHLKSYYAKQAEKNSSSKIKTVSVEPEFLFKPSESLGTSDAQIGTEFQLLDRVVTVRLGTGVPIGSHGTIVGIMYAPIAADICYEVLFDNLSNTNLDTFLLGKTSQTCRIKVRSYHLLNYSHSIRCRSFNEYNMSISRSISHRQQIESNRPVAYPKSAPATIIRENPLNTSFTPISPSLNPTATPFVPSNISNVQTNVNQQ